MPVSFIITNGASPRMGNPALIYHLDPQLIYVAKSKASNKTFAWDHFRETRFLDVAYSTFIILRTQRYHPNYLAYTSVNPHHILLYITELKRYRVTVGLFVNYVYPININVIVYRGTVSCIKPYHLEETKRI